MVYCATLLCQLQWRFLPRSCRTSQLPQMNCRPRPPSSVSSLILETGETDHYGLRLFWKDNSQNESGFEIHNGNESRRVGAQTTFYRWGDMTPGQYMCFRIRAYNDAGSSAWEPNVEPWYRCGTTSKGSPPLFDQVNTTGYAGYGGKGQEFRYVGGTWWVPRVECPLSDLRSTRAAPWVGLTGKDLKDKNTFLIQVGTISHCQASIVYNKAFWQVFRRSSGGTDPITLFDVRKMT